MTTIVLNEKSKDQHVINLIRNEGKPLLPIGNKEEAWMQVSGLSWIFLDEDFA